MAADDCPSQANKPFRCCGLTQTNATIAGGSSMFQDGCKPLFLETPLSIHRIGIMRMAIPNLLRKAFMLCYQLRHLHMTVNDSEAQACQRRYD